VVVQRTEPQQISPNLRYVVALRCPEPQVRHSTTTYRSFECIVALQRTEASSTLYHHNVPSLEYIVVLPRIKPRVRRSATTYQASSTFYRAPGTSWWYDVLNFNRSHLTSGMLWHYDVPSPEYVVPSRCTKPRVHFT
jgi:hypothetical protein